MILEEHFFNPRNVGDAHEPSFVGRAASLSCGACVRLSIQIDESLHISEAKFKAAGCSVLVAASSLLTERVTGMTPSEAAVFIQSQRNPSAFSDYPDCVKLACDALIGAIQQYSDAARNEWNGDEALICTCFCVSERVIETEVEQKGLTTVSEVIKACSAGGGCGSCHPLIEEIIESSACHRDQ